MAPQIRYFLVRPDLQEGTSSGGVTVPGRIVPLVAVDQLPDWLDIIGAPRELRVEQTAGLCNLGEVAMTAADLLDVRLYKDILLSVLHGADNTNVPGPDENEMANGNGINTPKTAPKETNSHPIELQPDVTTTIDNHVAAHPQYQQHPAEKMLQASRHAPSASSSTHAAIQFYEELSPHHSLARLPKPGAASNKHTRETKGIAPPGSSANYCRHWCHHGTCKWGLICRYQHIMPMTIEGLREVGLKDLPRWWTTAMGLSLVAGMGRGVRPMTLGLGAASMGPGGLFRPGGSKERKRIREMMAMLPQPITPTLVRAEEVRASSEVSPGPCHDQREADVKELPAREKSTVASIPASVGNGKAAHIDAQARVESPRPAATPAAVVEAKLVDI